MAFKSKKNLFVLRGFRGPRIATPVIFIYFYVRERQRETARARDSESERQRGTARERESERGVACLRRPTGNQREVAAGLQALVAGAWGEEGLWRAPFRRLQGRRLPGRNSEG